MENALEVSSSNDSLLKKKDFLLVSLIGISFALFSLPIIKNLNLPFFKINLFNALALIVFFLIFANIAILAAAFIGRKIPVVFQFAKFAAVGSFNSFFDWGILNLLISFTGIAGGLYYTIFKGVSFIFATVGSFFWNKYWTFEKETETDSKETGSFFIVSIAGLLINITLASAIVYFFRPATPSETDLNRLANIGAFSATLASLAWNFVGYKFIVFKK